MSRRTYLNAIKKIKSDPLSFLFSSHAEKRERQLAKFQRAADLAVQRTAQPTLGLDTADEKL